jgi:hypothetical protein
MKDVRPEHDAELPREGEGHDPDFEFSIARSNTFVPLLTMFGLGVLLLTMIIVRARPVVRHVEARADHAFSPADFPGLFGTDEALVGLDTRGGRSAKLIFPVPAPPFSEGIFPCSTCHAAIPPNPEKRVLDGMHGDIVFEHDAENRWCLDCHDETDRDKLRLANGGLVPFTESYRLCGQCHGTQFRDWRAGIRGKKTGYWDGSKRYLLCVHCHNPHSPKFAAVKPLPPPVRPHFLRPEDARRAQMQEDHGSGEDAHGG